MKNIVLTDKLQNLPVHLNLPYNLKSSRKVESSESIFYLEHSSELILTRAYSR